MSSSGLFTDSEADKIALLFVYFPIIRSEIYSFVRLWNNHRIRYQKNRPSLPTGKPSVLYFTPPAGIRDYQYIPDNILLAELEAEVAGWGKIPFLDSYFELLLFTNPLIQDPEEFLPPITLTWCYSFLQRSNKLIVLPITLSDCLSDGTLIHEKAYHDLRTALQVEVFGCGYTLPRCLPPGGAYNWTPPPTSTVEILSLPGEDIILEEALHFPTFEAVEPLHPSDTASGNDDTDTND